MVFIVSSARDSVCSTVSDKISPKQPSLLAFLGALCVLKRIEAYLGFLHRKRIQQKWRYFCSYAAAYFVYLAWMWWNRTSIFDFCSHTLRQIICTPTGWKFIDIVPMKMKWAYPDNHSHRTINGGSWNVHHFTDVSVWDAYPEIEMANEKIASVCHFHIEFSLIHSNVIEMKNEIDKCVVDILRQDFWFFL